MTVLGLSELRGEEREATAGWMSFCVACGNGLTGRYCAKCGQDSQSAPHVGVAGGEEGEDEETEGVPSSDEDDDDTTRGVADLIVSGPRARRPNFKYV